MRQSAHSAISMSVCQSNADIVSKRLYLPFRTAIVQFLAQTLLQNSDGKILNVHYIQVGRKNLRLSTKIAVISETVRDRPVINVDR